MVRYERSSFPSRAGDEGWILFPRSGMSEPVICFGQQPCGFLPKRFFYAKVVTAQRLRERIGGRIVYFCHDSDHDYRETTTILQDLKTGETKRLNFEHKNKVQKKYSPLYLKGIHPGWQERLARVLPCFVKPELVDLFMSVQAGTVADFCLGMYEASGLLEGIAVVRSSDPEFRQQTADLDDFYVDVPYQGEIVRARWRKGRLWLHRGGEEYLEVPYQEPSKEKISASRDTRLKWMQSAIGCTHYVTGASEIQYLNREETPEVTFVEREALEDAEKAFVDLPLMGPGKPGPVP